MKDLKGTKTLENLQAAFAGESQAHTKYQYYASQAQKDGYEQIADIFLETAGNEKEHAKLWFKLIHDGVPKTITNLRDAASGENYEHTIMYQDFAKTARAEGFTVIADLFEGVAAIEERHEQRYERLSQHIEKGKTFKREAEQLWKCRNCGHIHSGTSAPDICPVCQHSQSFFEIRATNY